MSSNEHALESAIIAELRHHLTGWRRKIRSEFEENNFNKELLALKSDPLYPKFNFDTPDYVNIRFFGRVSISIGRRLGEIYDKIPRRLAMERYGISSKQVAPKLGGLQLDISLRFSEVSREDAAYISSVCKKHIKEDIKSDGIGIEIRYNFNPNDSSRLRKDVSMAEKLIDANLRPVYLVFSSISPRQEAISRLERAGWCFLIGQNAIDFSTELLGLDLGSIWDRPAVKNEIKREVDGMMNDIKTSHAFLKFNKKV